MFYLSLRKTEKQNIGFTSKWAWVIRISVVWFTTRQNRSDTKTLKHFVFFSTVPQTICSSLPRDKLSLLKTRCFFSCPFSQKWELFHMKHCKSRLMPGLASEALLSRLTPGEQRFSSWVVSVAKKHDLPAAKKRRSTAAGERVSPSNWARQTFQPSFPWAVSPTHKEPFRNRRLRQFLLPAGVWRCEVTASRPRSGKGGAWL